MRRKLSTESSESGSVANNDVKGVVRRRKTWRFCAQVVHLVMVLLTSRIWRSQSACNCSKAYVDQWKG